MSSRRYFPGLILALVILLIIGGLLYWRGYRLMQHLPATGPAAPAPEAKEERKILYWVSTMDPSFISKKPGKDTMGMVLKPVYEGEAAAPGTIAVDPRTQQSMGVQIAKVEVRPLSRVIRAVGKVTYDESQLAVVNTKTDGWVTRLFIKITGEPVHKGQKLLSIFSRELVPAQREYLLALQNLNAIGKSRFPEMAGGARRLAEASRVRLENFDITPAEIATLETTGEVKKSLTLLSPVTGIVTKRMVTQGQYVMSGMSLLEVADLSHVWVDAEIYEYELPWVRVGQKAVMTLEYLPGRTYTGRIAYVYPSIKPETRTARVRLEFPNPGIRLKPDMFAQVEIRDTLPRPVVAVPPEAVLNSGEKHMVFLALGEGRFQPREIEVGAEGEGEWREVLSGLKGGENVVVSAQFLLDSESRIREAARKMLAPSPQEPEAPATMPQSPPPAAPEEGKIPPPVHKH